MEYFIPFFNINFGSDIFLTLICIKSFIPSETQNVIDLENEKNLNK